METATGTVQAQAKVSGTPGTFASRMEQLARALLHQVRQAYPLRGRILHVSSQGMVLNIGAVQGVTPGLRLQVLGDDSARVNG